MSASFGQTYVMMSLHDDLRDPNLFGWSLRAGLYGQCLERIQNIFAPNEFAEDCVFLVEMRRRAEGNVELRTIRTRSLVRHRHNPSTVMLGGISEVVLVTERCAPT